MTSFRTVFYISDFTDYFIDCSQYAASILIQFGHNKTLEQCFSTYGSRRYAECVAKYCYATVYC